MSISTVVVVWVRLLTIYKLSITLKFKGFMPRHPFHIVDPRPWPIMVSVYILSVAAGLIA